MAEKPATKTTAKAAPKAEAPPQEAPAVEPAAELVTIDPKLVLEVDYDKLKALREPFPENQVGKLPRPFDNKAPKFKCDGPNSQASVDSSFCGGFHGRGIHLDYVGHAALTARLLDVDPEWNWEPMALGPDGLPKFDGFGGLWIRLTVGGMTRPGYGDSQGKTGGNAVKEAIGDALRNAGMRFGIALELWHKGDLYEADVESGRAAVDTGPAAAAAAAKPAAKPRGRAAAKAPVETPAEEPQEPAGDDGPPMALGEPDPADPGHPLPPSGWEDRVAIAPTLAALQDVYEEAARDGWWDTMIVAPKFTARKAILKAQAEAAAGQVAQSFNQEG